MLSCWLWSYPNLTKGARATLLPEQHSAGTKRPRGVPGALLRLTLFGAMGATLAWGERPAPVPQGPGRALAVLASVAPRPVLRTRLITLLWGRREREQAHGSLRQSAHELRLALGPPCWQPPKGGPQTSRCWMTGYGWTSAYWRLQPPPNPAAWSCFSGRFLKISSALIPSSIIGWATSTRA